MNLPIYSHLQKLKEENRTPFHMPGHKRKTSGLFNDIEAMDITEIDGYDNLHNPKGIIRQSMDEMKKIYGTRESWYLVNGTTVGILASVSAICQPGDKIIIGRNCHKSVYNIIRLLHLRAFYLFPSENENYDILEDFGEKERKNLKEILEQNGDIKAVLITSPTYEGVVSDIEALKEILKPYNIPLIVDEAHGAHFMFHEYFPESAVKCGADLVIQSTHKTLPSFTQTAVLHLCSDCIPSERIQEMLAIYETSSPSYLLMASAEYGIMYMHNYPEKVGEYVDNLKIFREKCGQLKHIHLLLEKDLACFDYDKGKLVFSVKNTEMDGKKLFQILLSEYNLELEMVTCSYGIAMTSVCDEKEDFDHLFDALYEIDSNLDKSERNKDFLAEKSVEEKEKHRNIKNTWNFSIEKKLESWEALEREKEEITLTQAEGRICGDYILLYPPGIPLLIPGEKIVKEIVENLSFYLYNGYNVLGMKKDIISVLKEENR